jgi:hypothetical protein
MKAVEIKTELKALIDSETDLRFLESIKSFFERKDINTDTEKEMISRVEESEIDIREGNVYTIEEAEARLNQRFGL